MRRVPILLYHSVDDDPRADVRRWSVEVRRFRDHMALLRGDGWETFTITSLLSALRHGETLPERSVAITFADGFEDVLPAALPAMDGMTATVYATSGYLRGAEEPVAPPGRMLDARQLRELRDAGLEVGVHGHRHVALDAVSRSLARRDIRDSKARIEDALGAATPSFAYPYGYHDRSVQAFVREVGFRNAVGVKNVHSHDRDDLWGIARITIERDTTTAVLQQMLAEPDPPIAPDSDRLVTVGWRAVRRARTLLAGHSA